MNQQTEFPESLPQPSVQDQITDIAIDLVDQFGVDDQTGELKTAVFYVPDNEAQDGKYPSIKVSIPKEEFSEKYQWRAGLTFGNQSANLSTNVLVSKDGSIKTSDYSEARTEELMTSDQMQNFLDYLEKIKDNLIPDNRS